LKYFFSGHRTIFTGKVCVSILNIGFPLIYIVFSSSCVQWAKWYLINIILLIVYFNRRE
jgi:hypothetical protein